MKLLIGEQSIKEYFQRSYTSVDGLWFMKVEEKYGFEAALEIDRAVWGVFPKIQARMLQNCLEVGTGIEALKNCLSVKHQLEDFKFSIDTRRANEFDLVISYCPWFQLIKKSGREHLAGRVGDVICNTEYPVWAAEFGPEIGFTLMRQCCKGAEQCILRFETTEAAL